MTRVAGAPAAYSDSLMVCPLTTSGSCGRRRADGDEQRHVTGAELVHKNTGASVKGQQL